MSAAKPIPAEPVFDKETVMRAAMAELASMTPEELEAGIAEAEAFEKTLPEAWLRPLEEARAEARDRAQAAE